MIIGTIKKREELAMLTIQQISDGVSIVANEFPIKKAELFGSYANGSQHPASDVDILVEFTTTGVSLLTISRIKRRLEGLLGTDVDIVHAPVPPDSILEIDRRVSIYGA